jgi:hypothetical protein
MGKDPGPLCRSAGCRPAAMPRASCESLLGNGALRHLAAHFTVDEREEARERELVMLCRGRRRLPRVSIVLEEAFKWSSLHLWGRDGAVVRTCMLEEAVQRERPLPSRRGNTRCGRCTAVAGAALARPSTADSICLAGTRPMSPSPRGLHWPRPRRLARGSRRRCECTCHQGDSVALRWTQVPSEALRCHQRHQVPSEALRFHQRHSGAIQRHSNAIKCTQVPSEALRCVGVRVQNKEATAARGSARVECLPR